ncbi:MAG: FecR domain-containing protein, partial [Gammaproteobacteria bacterium]|nr:FecR domain-containing protein [Gammaproteobacteria bacterium]
MTTNTDTTVRKSGSTLFALSFVLVLMLLPITVLAEAGKIIFIIGSAEVISEDFSSKKAVRGMLLDSGDTLKTSEKGQIQVRMADGGLVAVRPNSEFKIDEFVYTNDIENDKNFYSLIKGGFRSVTGAIGQANKAAYKVDTPVATIGIRGTDFTARLCDTACDADSGLYIGVMSGGVTLTNDAGTVDIDPSEFGFVSDINADPVLLDQAPGEVLFSQVSSNTSLAGSGETDGTTTATQQDSVIIASEASTDTGTNLNFNNIDNTTVVTNSDSGVVENPVIDTPVVDTPTEEIAVVEDPIVTPTPDIFRHVTMTGHDKSPLVSKELTESVIYATDGQLDSFKITNTSGSVFEYSRDTAIAAVDTGSTTNNEVSWGRWTDMNLIVTDNSGTNTVAVTDANSVHWGISNEFEEVTLPISGSFSYQVVGGTTPTDNQGGLGTLSTTASSQLSNVDFASQTASLNLSINNLVDPEDELVTYNWSLQYDMAIHADGTLHSTNDETNLILMAASGHPSLSSGDTISGSATGAFAGFRTDAAPTAAVISYEANRTYAKWQSAGTIDYQIRGVVAAELMQ